MKRFYKILAVLFVLTMMLSLSVPAFAADGPSAEDIAATGDDVKIELPKEESYLKEYKTRYINAPEYFSLSGYSLPREGTQRPRAVVFHGARVRVLAEQDGYSCVQYRTMCMNMVTAWIPDSLLSDEYPGKTVELGSPSGSLATKQPEPDWNWGRYPGTAGLYLLLDEAVENCTGFTLDYEVTARNGSDITDIKGVRDILVNDGQKWYKVGSFDYDKLGPVHVVVALDKAMTVESIGTIAHCEEPDIYTARQDVLDFYTA